MPFVADSAWVNEVRPSPNFAPRKQGQCVRFVVLHGTWMMTDEAALERLCDLEAEVSCHYYIGRDGKVTQLVAEENTAWHAGKSFWCARDGEAFEGLNGWSIGIEIGNAGPFLHGAPEAGQELAITEAMWAKAEPYTDAAYDAVVRLLRDIMQRHGLSVEDVLGHDQIAPDRKSDPGKHFDWERVRRGLE